MTSPSDAERWRVFLSEYHHDHAGITEDLLDRAIRPDVGTAYDWMRAAIPATPGRVVDIACGSAPLRRLFTPPTRYLGLDVSRSELSLARDRDRGPLAEASALRLPLRDRSADVVTCSMAIMLLDPVSQALSEVSRVLTRGGLFVTTRPVTFPVRWRDVRLGAELFAGLKRMPELPQRFTRTDLVNRHAAAGLEVVSDSALRFPYPLRTEEDARRIVDGLYLPTVPAERRAQAVERLSRLAGPNREVPISIRRTVAIRRLTGWDELRSPHRTV
jgi:SAM-dependent methyltransferase